MAANPYENGARKLIPAVLIYVKRAGRVLMIHRDGKPGDYHSGKWNGLGGKLEQDESPLEAARRELREESGLDLPDAAFKSLGVLQFPLFKAHKNEDWIVWVFEAQGPSGSEPLSRSEEGSLHWIAEGELLGLALWPGDRYFLPLVLEGKPFMGTIWYRGQEVARHWVCPL